MTFEESSSSKEVPTSLSEIFTNQRNRSYYELLYIHPDYAGVTAILICIPMVKMLVIHGKRYFFLFIKCKGSFYCFNKFDSKFL